MVDHTGRTNYLAHHLIFEYSEIYSLNVTPAEILLFGSGWLDVWPKTSPPTYLNDGDCNARIPSRDASLGGAPLWAQVAGVASLASELGERGKWKFVATGRITKSRPD